MRERIEAHVDDASAEPGPHTQAEIIFPKPFEGRTEAELLDLGPCGEKTAPPFA